MSVFYLLKAQRRLNLCLSNREKEKLPENSHHVLSITSKIEIFFISAALCDNTGLHLFASQFSTSHQKFTVSCHHTWIFSVVQIRLEHYMFTKKKSFLIQFTVLIFLIKFSGFFVVKRTISDSKPLYCGWKRKKTPIQSSVHFCHKKLLHGKNLFILVQPVW